MFHIRLIWTHTTGLDTVAKCLRFACD